MTIQIQPYKTSVVLSKCLSVHWPETTGSVEENQTNANRERERERVEMPAAVSGLGRVGCEFIKSTCASQGQRNVLDHKQMSSRGHTERKRERREAQSL